MLTPYACFDYGRARWPHAAGMGRSSSGIDPLFAVSRPRAVVVRSPREAFSSCRSPLPRSIKWVLTRRSLARSSGRSLAAPSLDQVGAHSPLTRSIKWALGRRREWSIGCLIPLRLLDRVDGSLHHALGLIDPSLDRLWALGASSEARSGTSAPSSGPFEQALDHSSMLWTIRTGSGPSEKPLGH